MLIGGELGHRRHWITLTAGYQQQKAIFVHLPRFVGIDEDPIRDIELSVAVRRLDVAKHASAQKRNFPSVVARKIENNLDPVNGTRETTDHDPPGGFIEDLFERGNYCALRLGPAGTLSVG